MAKTILFDQEKFRVEECLEKIASKRLNLQPDFQRFYIWDKKKERSFIDTLLRGYAMPPLWLWARTAKGKTSYDVIDGQQRLTCIRRFVDNEFDFRPDAGIENDTLRDSSGAFFNKKRARHVLSEEMQNHLMNYPVPMITVSTNDRTVVIDMFKRLNRSSTTLLPQELRNAFYQGHFKSLIYELTAGLQADPYWGARVFEKDTRDRMGDQQHVSELMVAMIKGKPLDKSDQVEEYYRDFDDKCADCDAWTRQFERALKVVKRLLPATSRFTNNKSDFYSLCLGLN